MCGRSADAYSRIVGYMRPVSQWNEGKREEFRDRRLFDRMITEQEGVSHPTTCNRKEPAASEAV